MILLASTSMSATCVARLEILAWRTSAAGVYEMAGAITAKAARAERSLIKYILIVQQLVVDVGFRK